MADKKVVQVVVLKRKTVRHDGETYPENTLMDLSEADAAALIKAGFVATPASLLASVSSAATGATVTTRDGTAVVQGPVETQG
ncbi:hypothetical protein [Sodalis sp. C49]|uniref:hypothetical protein n=1 Tax=Sodalis sp. C49 TaxID=3228929 RepID=UPI003965AAD0